MQAELNDLMHDLELSKNKARFIGSSLLEGNVLATDICISMYSDRLKDFINFLTHFRP